MIDFDVKERRLQQVVAVSGFLFALCLLPIAQYLLVTNRLSSGEQKALESDQQSERTIDGRVVANSANRSGDQPAQAGEDGEVAGVSTEPLETPLPLAKTYASMEDCLDARDRALTDLDAWLTNYKQAQYRKFSVIENEITAYRQALLSFVGTPEDKAALETLIQEREVERAPYLKKLGDAESAVASQKASIASRSCP